MLEPTFDASGYPTEETLDAISNWDPSDIDGLMLFVLRAWNTTYGDVHRDEAQGSTSFVTGAWSGNEDLINALARNLAAWSQIWISSERGGLFRFDILLPASE